MDHNLIEAGLTHLYYRIKIGFDKIPAAMITLGTIQDNRTEILRIAKSHGASQIRIFGSVARGDATDSSDLDIIVHFDPERSLLDHGGLVMDLRELLGVRVDVIDDEGMTHRFRDHVAREAIPL